MGYTTMGEQIKKYRKAKKISQKNLAEIMQITRNSVINWESNRYKPDINLIPKLCMVLKISPNDLFDIYPPNHINDHEDTLLDQYRKISPFGQKIIDHLISDILTEERAEKENPVE